MLALQYSFDLPPDHDMNLIRSRVAEKGPLFDQVPGLLQKSFLISDRALGAAANRYAPFYLWRDVAPMLDFLTGERFRAVTQAFGWPAARVWSVLEFDRAADPSTRGSLATPTSLTATREITTVSPHADLASLREGERAAQTQAMTADAGVHSRIVALDPDRWELVRFTLWRHAAPAGTPGDAYQVLHLSQPG